MQALRSSRGGGAHHHLLPGAIATTARPFVVGVDDENQLIDSTRAIQSSSHNTITSSSSSSSSPTSSSWSVEDEGVLSEAIGRSARHVNGIPCFLLQAYRSYARHLQRPSTLWEVIKTAVKKADVAAAAALASQTQTSKAKKVVSINEHHSSTSSSSTSSSHELSRDLFDNLIVLAVHYVQRFIFPAFVVSPCFFLYSNMLLFAFSRPVKTRANFEWIKPLGRGGYGMVYAAQSSDTGKLYAVKCMDKRLIKSRHATRMIMNERDILASVSHPFVTGLQFAFHDDANVFLVLDLKTGGDLEHYLLHMTRGFSENEVRFFLAEILLGVAYLHSHGIMHRDLKPANILIDQNGHLSISDLGLAVFFAPSTTSSHKAINGLSTSSTSPLSSSSVSTSSTLLTSPLSSSTPPSMSSSTTLNNNAMISPSSFSPPPPHHASLVNTAPSSPPVLMHIAVDTNTAMMTGESPLLSSITDTATAAANIVVIDHVPGLPSTYSAPLSPGVTTMTVSPFASIVEVRDDSVGLSSSISNGAAGGGGVCAPSSLLSSSLIGLKSLATSVSAGVADPSSSATTADNCLFGSSSLQHASWGGGGAAKQLAVNESLSSSLIGVGGGGVVQPQIQTSGSPSTIRVQSSFVRYNSPQQSPTRGGGVGGGSGGGGFTASPTLPVFNINNNNSISQKQHQHQQSLLKAVDHPNPSSSVLPIGGGGVQPDVNVNASNTPLLYTSSSAFTTNIGKSPHASRKAPLAHSSTTPICPTSNTLWGKTPGGASGVMIDETPHTGNVGVGSVMNSSNTTPNNNNHQTHLHDRSRSTTPLGSPTVPSSSPMGGSAMLRGRCSLGGNGGGKVDGGSSSAWEWDQNLTFTAAEGAGISASEEAGYTFGSHENGVRGKAGTPGFWAPEMLFYERDGKGKRYGPAADWWSFGCLAYALLASKGPFTVIGGDTADDNNATLQNEPDLTSSKLFSPEAADLISKLLIKDPRQRLGSGAGGAEDIMNHAFFKGINWDAIQQKRTAPPFTPTFNVLAMTKPVRSWSEKDKAKLAGVTLTVADQARYVGVPFSSQVSVYKAIIQNMALREYVEAELGGAIEPREGHGREEGGGRGSGGSGGGSGGSNSVNATARSDKSGSGGGGSVVAAASASVHRSNNNHHKSGATTITTTLTTTTTTTTTAHGHTKRHVVRQSVGTLPSSPLGGVTSAANAGPGGGGGGGGGVIEAASVTQSKLPLNKRDCCIS